MRKDEEWLKQYQDRTGLGYTDIDGKKVEGRSSEEDLSVAKKKSKPKVSAVHSIQQPAPAPFEFAPEVGKRKKNKTERRFEQDFLMPAHIDGKLKKYYFERLTFLLADGTRYTPDFHGYWENGVIQIWEIKGPYIYEDGKVKYKCAAEQFVEFAFQLVQWKEKRWTTLHSARC